MHPYTPGSPTFSITAPYLLGPKKLDAYLSDPGPGRIYLTECPTNFHKPDYKILEKVFMDLAANLFSGKILDQLNMNVSGYKSLDSVKIQTIHIYDFHLLTVLTYSLHVQLQICKFYFMRYTLRGSDYIQISHIVISFYPFQATGTSHSSK